MGTDRAAVPAYFSEGEHVGDRDAMIRLGAEAGLDAGDVRGAPPPSRDLTAQCKTLLNSA
jgi:predicted DsbA family dithiol-disulfide isomerase